MRGRNLLIVLGVVALVAVLAIIFVPRLLQPQPDLSQAAWPTQGWATITPEEGGLDSAKLAAGLQAVQEGNIAVDSLAVIRNGAVLLDASFAPV